MTENIKPLPPEVLGILNWWTPQVEDILKEKIRSIVLSGSAAVGDFSPKWSDVDACVLLSEPASQGEAERLFRVHDEMRDEYIGRRKDGWQSGQVIEAAYIPARLADHPHEEGTCVLCYGSTRKIETGHPISPFDRENIRCFGKLWVGAEVRFAPAGRIELEQQSRRDLEVLKSPPAELWTSGIWMTGMITWTASTLAFWRDGDLLSKNAALRREIESGSPWTEAFRFALRMREEGSAVARLQRDEAERHFRSIAGPAEELLDGLIVRKE